MGDIDHIGQLKPDQKNARKHNPRNVGMIRDALGEVGAARSIVIDEEGNILAGNATIEAAAEAGIERVQVVDADGETIIAVRRAGLSEEKKRRLAYYDNRTAELAEWDVEQVALDMEEGLVLDGIFYDSELARIGVDLPDVMVDYAAMWQGMPAFEQEDNFGAVATIKVHFASIEDISTFAELVGQTVTPKTKYIWYPKQERKNLKLYVADES